MKPLVRRLHPDDVGRCLDLAARVGWPRETTKWSLLFEHGPGHGVEGDDGSLVAMVMTPRHRNLSFVAMMVVDPRVQGRGLGRHLLTEVLKDTPGPIGLYATEAGRPLYERLGFVPVDEVSKHIGLVDGSRAPPDGEAEMRLDEARILELDRITFGVDRSAFIGDLLKRAERVITDEADGFAIRWSNGHLSVVGPMVAADEARAMTLLERSLVGAAGPIRVDIPTRFPRLIARATEYGLAPKGRAPLMTYPTAWLEGDRDRYAAIALQAFG